MGFLQEAVHWLYRDMLYFLRGMTSLLECFSGNVHHCCVLSVGRVIAGQVDLHRQGGNPEAMARPREILAESASTASAQRPRCAQVSSAALAMAAPALDVHWRKAVALVLLGAFDCS